MKIPVFEVTGKTSVGIPLPLYNDYIALRLSHGLTVKMIYEELQSVGYLHRYGTFAKYVSLKVKTVKVDQTGKESVDMEIKHVLDDRGNGNASAALSDGVNEENPKTALKNKLTALMQNDNPLNQLAEIKKRRM